MTAKSDSRRTVLHPHPVPQLLAQSELHEVGFAWQRLRHSVLLHAPGSGFPLLRSLFRLQIFNPHFQGQSIGQRVELLHVNLNASGNWDGFYWVTDFYTLGGAALFDNAAPAVSLGPEFLYTTGAELSKRAAPPSPGEVYNKPSPIYLQLCRLSGVCSCDIR